MRYLLDTHVWLWLQTDPDRLGQDFLHELTVADELMLSAASAWEIAIKYRLGKLPLPEPPATYVPSRLRTSGVSALPVQMPHVLAVAELPLHHRDPFDRVLVAQSQLLAVELVTADTQLQAYEVDLVLV